MMFVTPEYWSRIDIDPNFWSLVCGKRCIVVGPASSIHGSQKASEIESYDLVVRINNALPTPEHTLADVGSRCDVLCHNEKIEETRWMPRPCE